jgi:hypothetical protein
MIAFSCGGAQGKQVPFALEMALISATPDLLHLFVIIAYLLNELPQ